MVAGDVYTVAGSASGSAGRSGDGGAAGSALLDVPHAVGLDAAGDLYIADSGNDVVREVPATTAYSHDQAGDIYTVAGTGTAGTAGASAQATASQLPSPAATATDASGDLYIVDEGNNRVQEVAATAHTQWGVPMAAGDVYTVAGSASGASGTSDDGGAATSGLLYYAVAVAVDSSGDL
jgi:hypothetical protein